MKRLLAVIFFLFFVFFFQTHLFAAGEFQSEFEATYQFDDSGTAHVSQEISLTNNLSTAFASKYRLSVQGGGLKNIKASDGEGSLAVAVEKNEKKTEIELTFNQKVVGKNKTLVFNLEYDAEGLAEKSGQIWEINLPRADSSEEVSHYSLKLSVPRSYGQLTHLSPEPFTQSRDKDFDHYFFESEALKKAGVDLVYGQFQIFDFVLQYHLHNSGLTAKTAEIALPPDTAFQQVFYHRLEPEPFNVVSDPDGNWLAQYQLAGGEKMNVTASGKAKILPEPRKEFSPPSDEVLSQNKEPSLYWPVKEPLMSKTVQGLNTVKEVYDLVVSTLKYDNSRFGTGERLGAEEALKNPHKAICMEFTDLFVTLARTAGFPAREINGYAYTNNPKLRPLGLVTDILHAWPEFWDEDLQVWKPVDPTWEKTTGGIDHFSKTDLNHFAFAIHGLNSQGPAPAGTYKQAESQSKDIQIIFGQYAPEPEPDLEVIFETANEIYRENQGKGKLIVKNNGPAAVYGQKMILNSENFKLKTPAEFTLDRLPPYGHQEIPFQFFLTGFNLGQGKLIVNLNDRQYSHPVKVRSYILEKILPAAGIGTLLTFLILRVKKKKG